jgi:hypothetical protein
MGFLDGLGSALGKLGAMAQEVQGYKGEYESMSDVDLKREYNALKNKSGTENKNRLMAVTAVLKDRGYGQS